MGKKKDSSDVEQSPSQDTLQLPIPKMRVAKSPTPISVRDRSATPLRRSQTPIRGRSQTPVAIYMTRRSATPSGYRSISPFMKRDEREKTPFELGGDMKMQITCNKAVLDRALVMDISEPEDIQKPVRYITSDLSIIDRAAVMDVSNVEVIYVVEEYEELEEGAEEAVDPKSKRRGSRDRRDRKERRSIISSDREDSVVESTPEPGYYDSTSREVSADVEEVEETTKKGKKKSSKKRDKKDKSPSPQLTLKLEIGGGQKATKKMFEEKSARPPTKKSKKALLEEKAKAAKAAKEAEAERQRILKKEKEERERKEAEERARKAAEEAAAAEAAAAAAAAAAAELEAAEAEYYENWDEEEGEYYDEEGYGEEGTGEQEEEVVEEVPDPKKARHGSTSSEEYVRPDPEEEERWQPVAKEETNDFMKLIGKYTHPEKLTEKERDRDWKRNMDKGRLPRFVILLSDQSAHVGQSIRLSCAYDGPGVSVRWFKKDRQLERDEHNHITNRNNTLTLLINESTISDSGLYKCVIANMNGESTSSCIVTVYDSFSTEVTPPSFRLVREYYHMHDDELVIECQVLGVPHPKITWYWEGMDLTSSYKHSIVEEDHGVCKLLIYKPTFRDDGRYICLAENSCGEAKISHMVEVSSDRHYPLPGVFHARDFIQQDKERATRKLFKAALQSKAESDRRLGRTIGSIYNSPSFMAEETTAKSYISQNAEKDMQDEKRGRMPDSSPKGQLHFISQLANRYVAVGSKVHLQAIVGGPKAKTRWFKDDKVIEYDERIHHKTVAGVAKLIFEVAKIEDSGKYTLIAENEFSKITTPAQLHVYQTTFNTDVEPVFPKPIKETYRRNGIELELETTVRGNPRPDVWWYRDGADILPSERVVIQYLEDGTCRLTIDGINYRDSGKYSVVASNRAGKASIFHNIEIEATVRPDSPGQEGKQEEQKQEVLYERRHRLPDGTLKDRLHIISNLSNRFVAEGSKVTLQAVIGGPKAVIHWKKDDEDLVYGPHIHHKNWHGLAKLIIASANLKDAGKYTVVAKNEYNEVTTSAKLHIYQPKVNTDIQPVFSRSLKEFYDFTVNELVLETGVRGNPTPEIIWFKDGLEIKNGRRLKIFEQEEGTLKLIIENPSIEDSGRYAVIARNSVGESSISHRVLFEPRPRPKIEENEELRLIKERTRQRIKRELAEMTEKPLPPLPDAKQQLFFRNHLSNRTVQEGTTVKWVVTIDGPRPTIVWYHNGKEIVAGPKCKFAYKNGIAWLKVFQVSKHDSGEYKIVAKGPENEIVSTCQLFTYSLDRQEMIAPSFATRIKDNYIGEDKVLVLDCRVHGKPRPSMEWLKDGEEIEIGEKYEQVDEDDGYSKLIINSPTKNDSGHYTCIARNDMSFTKMTHSVDFGGADLLYYEKTHGSFRRDPRKPHFLAPLGNQFIAVGGTAAICAEFLPMNDIFDVRWYQGRYLVEEDQDIKMIVDNGIYILILLDATASTQGPYTCRASTLLYGYTDSIANVDVAVAVPIEDRPPLFDTRPEKAITVLVGKPFKISATITDIKNMKFAVFQGTRDLTHSNRVTKEIKGDKVEFTIQTSKMDDSGIYFVVARNVFGTDRVYVVVTMTTEETEEPEE